MPTVHSSCRVATGQGSTDARLEVTDRIRTGVVSLPHGWRSPSVNRLTSADELDPRTGIPATAPSR